MARTRTSRKPREAPAVATEQAATHAHSNDASLRQLAHELNSLLDGSMRCVGVVRSSLQQQSASSSDMHAAEDSLGRAHAAMRHMAALLERAMKQSSASDPHDRTSTVALFDSKQSLAELLRELQDLLAPHARSANAHITIDIEAACERIPAGPLGTVIMNGLRNALQACEAITSNATPHKVTVHVACASESLQIRIECPKAVKPAGHRIGMNVSQQIVSELGGEMALTTSAQITSMRIGIPVENLDRHA